MGGLALALVTSGCYLLECRPRNQGELQTHVMKEVDLAEKNKKVLYASAEQYCRDYYTGVEGREGYVDFMAKHSSEVRSNIASKGKEEVIEKYMMVQQQCLDLAMSKLDSEIAEEDFDKLGDNLVKYMADNAEGTKIDYLHPCVKEGYIDFAKIRVGFFKKVVSANMKEGKIGDFNNVVRRVYTKKEFAEFLKQEAVGRKALYEGFAESLENFRDPTNPARAMAIRFFGPGVARKTGKKSQEFNDSEGERFFPIKD